MSPSSAIHGSNTSLYPDLPAYPSDFFNTHTCSRQSFLIRKVNPLLSIGLHGNSELS